MEKIRTFRQAEELVRKMLDDSTIELQLYDDMDSNKIIWLDSEGVGSCTVYSRDSVNGTQGQSFHYLSEVAQEIYDSRKFINQSGQLDRF